jgi:hypothetical protein
MAPFIAAHLSQPARAAGVYVAGGVGGESSNAGSVEHFNDAGQPIGSLAQTRSGPYISIAAHGNVIYVAGFGGLRKFSIDGTPLPIIGGITGIYESSLETDSRGNLYFAGHRVSPDGSIVQFSINGPRSPRATDSDRRGNVYIEGVDGPAASLRSGIYKYDALGNLLGFVTHPTLRTAAADMAIDEAGDVLYLRGERYELEAYDISGPLPVLLGAVPTPAPIFGLSFDAVTRHLLITQGDLFRAWELETDGTIIRRYHVRSDSSSFIHMDIVAIRVPEPTCACLSSIAVGLVMLHRRRSKNATK